MLTKEKLKEYAYESGADAIGIGSMDRFDGCPGDMDPRYIFPDAKSIIGLIFRIPRGYIRGVEEGTNFFQYPSMGYSSINEVVAPTAIYDIGKFIENHGYEAAVYRNTGGRGAVSDMTGGDREEESPELSGRAVKFSRPVAPDMPAPDVQMHFRLAAFICGLGEIGYSKMLLTPDFGPLNRQAFIFTDAEIEPDPIYDGPELCNNCMACANTCPGQCIDKKDTVKVTVAGHEIEWGKIDEWSCYAYYTGVNKESNPFLRRDAFKDIPDGEKFIRGQKAINYEEHKSIAGIISNSYPLPAVGYNPPKCGGCLRACYSSMEKRGVLRNKFTNTFRNNKPWKL